MKVRFRRVFDGIYELGFKNALCFLLFLCACGKEDIAKPDQSGLFIKFFGGLDSELSYATEETLDGGFIAIGTTHSFGKGGTDMYVFKTDANGNKQWEKTFGGGGFDEGKGVQLLPDGSFIFLGDYTQETGFQDLNLIKTDKDGNVQWSKTYGTQSKDEKAYTLKSTPDGGFFVIGNSVSANGSTDMYLVKAKADGEKEWEKNYGLTGLKDDIGSVQMTKKGNLIWCGSEHRERIIDGNAASNSDMRVILTQPEGNLLWDKNYGKENTETGMDIQVVDEGFIVVGTTLNLKTGNTDIYVVRLFEDGTEWWSETYGDTHNQEGASIYSTADGGFIITGNTDSEGKGGKDIYLLKIDRRGTQLWSKNFGGRLDDTGKTVRQTIDGGYIVSGTVTFENNTMICLIKTNAHGELASR